MELSCYGIHSGQVVAIGLDSRVAIVRTVEVRLVLKIQGKLLELELRR
jgi:hypothetical protein